MCSNSAVMQGIEHLLGSCTLAKPEAKKEGWSESALMKPRRLPLRNRRTAKPSPEVSMTLWAFRISMPATCSTKSFSAMACM